MNVVGIYNMKGGVGKTTTAVNLAAALATRGKQVSVVDLCAQGDATTHLGVDLDNSTDPFRPGAVPIDITEGLRLVPASPRVLSIYEFAQGSPRLQMDFLNRGEAAILDCPPATGRLSSAAVASSDVLIVPLAPGISSINKIGAIDDLLADASDLGQVRKSLKYWVLLTMYDGRRRVDWSTAAHLRASDMNVFESVIQYNVALNEAYGSQKDIIRFAPRSRGAQCYQALAEEVISLGII